MEAGDNAAIFNIRQAADVKNKLWASPARSQFEARAFDVAIRQSQAFTDLPQTETRKHLFLLWGNGRHLD